MEHIEKFVGEKKETLTDRERKKNVSEKMSVGKHKVI